MLSVGRLSVGFSKLHSTYRWEHFGGKASLKSNFVFVEHERKTIRLSVEKIWQYCQNCIQRVQMKVFRKNFFKEIFISLIIFQQGAKTFLGFCIKIWAGLSKLDSQVHRKILLKHIFSLQKLQKFKFLTIERKIFKWLSEKIKRGFQTAFYFSIAKF